MLNCFQHLGKDPHQAAGEQVLENVVIRLVEPYVGKGRNVTMDNFFTSLSLVNKLLAKKTSLAGIMNKVRREFSPSAQSKAAAQLLYSTMVLKNDKTTGPNCFEPNICFACFAYCFGINMCHISVCKQCKK
jgi:hypothetical protein